MHKLFNNINFEEFARRGLGTYLLNDGRVLIVTKVAFWVKPKGEKTTFYTDKNHLVRDPALFQAQEKKRDELIGHARQLTETWNMKKILNPKEPHEMTRAQWLEACLKQLTPEQKRQHDPEGLKAHFLAFHAREVEEAIAEKKYVPTHVKEEYMQIYQQEHSHSTSETDIDKQLHCLNAIYEQAGDLYDRLSSELTDWELAQVNDKPMGWAVDMRKKIERCEIVIERVLDRSEELRSCIQQEHSHSMGMGR